MATEKVYVGPNLIQFDNTAIYPDMPSETLKGIRADSMQCSGVPIDPNDVIRLTDLAGGLDAAISVVDINNPTELADQAGTTTRSWLLTVQANTNKSTLYVWVAASLSVVSPFVVAGDSGSWIAVAGHAVAGTMKVQTAPSALTDVVRLTELQAVATQVIPVADISNPAAELAPWTGWNGSLLVACEAKADQNLYTIYAFDEAIVGATLSVPYIVAGNGGHWVAVAGRYSIDSYVQSLAVVTNATVAGNLTVSSGYLNLTLGDLKLNNISRLFRNGDATLNIVTADQILCTNNFATVSGNVGTILGNIWTTSGNFAVGTEPTIVIDKDANASFHDVTASGDIDITEGVLKVAGINRILHNGSATFGHVLADDLTVSGNLVTTAGDIAATSGNIDTVFGDIHTSSGNFSVGTTPTVVIDKDSNGTFHDITSSGTVSVSDESLDVVAGTVKLGGVSRLLHNGDATLGHATCEQVSCNLDLVVTTGDVLISAGYLAVNGTDPIVVIDNAANIISNDITQKGRKILGADIAATDIAGGSFSFSATVASWGLIRVNPTSSITLASTPTIEAGVEGQEITIINTNATYTVSFQTKTTLSGSLLRLGAATRAVGPNGIIRLLFANGYWNEISFVA